MIPAAGGTMRKVLITIALVLSLGCGLFAAGEKPLNILFLGNSLTYTNDIPNTLKQIAAAEGITITVTTIANGGWTLFNHLNNAASTDAIAAGGWDYVVLQEQSQTSAYYPEMFAADAASLDALIKAAGARTLLYQNWPLNTEMGYQSYYENAWRTVAGNLCAVLVPAGDAWYDLYQNDSTTWATLYADDRHPSQRGAYLTACVFYSVLFGRAPVKQDPVFGLSAALSTQFQTAAEASVSPWRSVATVLSADTEATENGDTASVQFNITLSDFCDTIIYYSISGTASLDDIAPVTGSVVIAPGLTSAEINITALGDALTEGDETLTITLWGGPYYSIGAQNSVNLTLHDGPELSPTSTATFTDTPTATATFTETETATATFTDTATSTATFTDTATSTATFTDTATATATFTDTQTATATFTATETAAQETATETYTQTTVVSFTATGTMTAVPDATATPTVMTTAVTADFNIDFIIYPNPSKGRVLFVTGDTTGMEVIIKIYTQSFRLVAEKSLTSGVGVHEMDLTNFSSGIYIACLEAKAGGTAYRKVKPFVIIR